MIRADRRALLRLAATAVALPFLAPAALAATRFTPPAEPMRYTRRLERELGDEARLVVSRSFALRFMPEADGFRVDGSQVDVAVDAPAHIESLAKLERERVETGVFPLLLDASGLIRSVAPATSSAQLDAAVRDVRTRIAQWDHTPAEREQLRAFVDAVHRSAGQLVTALPRDLFAPVDCPREESRMVALPGGVTGLMQMTFDAVRDPATGLMREAWREVITEAAGGRRRTLESWTLMVA